MRQAHRMVTRMARDLTPETKIFSTEIHEVSPRLNCSFFPTSPSLKPQ